MIFILAIRDLESLLRSKKMSPKGQDNTRHLQVLQFMNMQLKRPLYSREQAARQVANAFRHGGKLGSFIMSRERSWVRDRYIPDGLQGRKGKIYSMLNDEGTLIVVRRYLASCKEKNSGYHLTAEDLAQVVANYWKSVVEQDQSQDNEENDDAVRIVQDTIWSLKELNEDPAKWSISSRAAVDWLHKLGYDWKEVRKGLFKDGHERDDVLQYRQDYFLPYLESLKSRIVQWDEKGGFMLGKSPEEIRRITGLTPIILITHDECIFNSNEGPRFEWVEKGSMPLRKKGPGAGIMVSCFITSLQPLRVPEVYSDHYLRFNNLTRIALESIEFGGDCWWNSEKMIKQIATQAIPIFNHCFPDCQGLFLFDNSKIHDSLPDNALRAYHMNLNPGGEAPSMKDTWFRDPRGNHIFQTTSFPDTPEIPAIYRGKPKGLKVILQERGLWHQGLRLRCGNSQKNCKLDTPGGCCARGLLSIQEDFRAQKSLVEEVIEEAGHLVLLYPKFHCELNWIEYFWGAAKWYTRKHCRYGIRELREKVPEGLKYAERFIGKFWGRSLRLMEGYRAGIEWAERSKKYASHRRVPVHSDSSL